MLLKRFLFDEVENIVVKGENASYQRFLLFSECFPKPSLGSLTLSQTNPGFYVSTVQVFENTVGKEEIARNE